ncbi:MAG: tetratricopeptide repeat protein [Dehalococcoidia bacterium]
MALDRQEKKTTSLQGLTKEAIALATRGQWEKAVQVNREIVVLSQGDVQAYNRLGKALMELGRYEEAQEAFNRGLEIAPNNMIAKKNLQKLSLLVEAGPARQGPQPQVPPHQFIEETGKTGVTKLVTPGPPEALARLGAGQPVRLRVEGKNLIVAGVSDEYIGQVEPRLAFRLLSLLEGGNRYEGAITSASQDGVMVILREVYQDPSQAGRVSFPSKSADDFRPDVKQSIIKHELGKGDPYHEGDSEHGAWEEGGGGDEVPEGITIIDGGRQTLKGVDDEEDEETP